MNKRMLAGGILWAALLTGCGSELPPRTTMTPLPEPSPVILPEERSGETGSLAEGVTQALDGVSRAAQDMGRWAEERMKQK